MEIFLKNVLYLICRSLLGFYMCMDASFGGYGDKAKLLFSPPSSFIGRISCLKFYYHMYGATINRLSVFHGNSVVFTKSGQQGYRWLYAEVTLFVQNTVSYPFEIETYIQYNWISQWISTNFHHNDKH